MKRLTVILAVLLILSSCYVHPSQVFLTEYKVVVESSGGIYDTGWFLDTGAQVFEIHHDVNSLNPEVYVFKAIGNTNGVEDVTSSCKVTVVSNYIVEVSPYR